MPFHLPRLTYKQYGILDAASPIFAHFGYAKTTLDDIGKALKMNKASLYYHFQNKEDLYRHILEREAGSYLSQMSEVAQDGKNPRKRILKYLGNRQQLLNSFPNLTKISIGEREANGPPLSKLLSDMRKAEIENIEKMISLGVTQKGWIVNDVSELATALLDMSTAFMNSASIADFGSEAIGSDMTKEEMRSNSIKLLTNFILRGLPTNSVRK